MYTSLRHVNFFQRDCSVLSNKHDLKFKDNHLTCLMAAGDEGAGVGQWKSTPVVLWEQCRLYQRPTSPPVLSLVSITDSGRVAKLLSRIGLFTYSLGLKISNKVKLTPTTTIPINWHSIKHCFCSLKNTQTQMLAESFFYVLLETLPEEQLWDELCSPCMHLLSLVGITNSNKKIT